MTSREGAVLLGYGGSTHSKLALVWADGLAHQLGRPLHVLVSALDVREARHAHVTVLGSRTRSTLAGMVLGSVSQLQHSHCPVAVVR